MGQNDQNGWNEYSKLVLQELERLSENIDSLKGELQEVRQEIAKMQVREDKVEELKSWKEKIDDVASPTQLKELVIEVDNIEELIDDVDDYNRFNDEELCEFLLNPTLCEGLIYTQRIYD